MKRNVEKSKQKEENTAENRASLQQLFEDSKNTIKSELEADFVQKKADSPLGDEFNKFFIDELYSRIRNLTFYEPKQYPDGSVRGMGNPYLEDIFKEVERIFYLRVHKKSNIFHESPVGYYCLLKDETGSSPIKCLQGIKDKHLYRIDSNLENQKTKQWLKNYILATSNEQIVKILAEYFALLEVVQKLNELIDEKSREIIPHLGIKDYSGLTMHGSRALFLYYLCESKITPIINHNNAELFAKQLNPEFTKIQAGQIVTDFNKLLIDDYRLGNPAKTKPGQRTWMAKRYVEVKPFIESMSNENLKTIIIYTQELFTEEFEKFKRNNAK